jgi:hypothetical protein
MAELTNMVERLPFTLFISAIDKQQHLLRSGPADDEPYGLALKLRPIFLHAPRITFQPLAFSPKPFAAIAQGHSYDQILAGELDLSREFCGPGFILHNSSFILSQSPASDYARFTLYRCTEFVTYTGSCVFAQGYAYSGRNGAVPAPHPALLNAPPHYPRRWLRAHGGPWRGNAADSTSLGPSA